MKKGILSMLFIGAAMLTLAPAGFAGCKGKEIKLENNTNDAVHYQINNSSNISFYNPNGTQVSAGSKPIIGKCNSETCSYEIQVTNLNNTICTYKGSLKKRQSLTQTCANFKERLNCDPEAANKNGYCNFSIEVNSANEKYVTIDIKAHRKGEGTCYKS